MPTDVLPIKWASPNRWVSPHQMDLPSPDRSPLPDVFLHQMVLPYPMVSPPLQCFISDLIFFISESREAEFNYCWRGCLFANPSWLMPGRTSGHQELVPTYPWIDNCLMATRRDFLEMKAPLWLNKNSQNGSVAGGWLSTSCCCLLSVGNQPLTPITHDYNRGRK